MSDIMDQLKKPRQQKRKSSSDQTEDGKKGVTQTVSATKKKDTITEAALEAAEAIVLFEQGSYLSTLGSDLPTLDASMPESANEPPSPDKSTSEGRPAPETMTARSPPPPPETETDRAPASADWPAVADLPEENINEASVAPEMSEIELTAVSIRGSKDGSKQTPKRRWASARNRNLPQRALPELQQNGMGPNHSIHQPCTQWMISMQVIDISFETKISMA